MKLPGVALSIGLPLPRRRTLGSRCFGSVDPEPSKVVARDNAMTSAKTPLPKSPQATYTSNGGLVMNMALFSRQ